eukprot:CAMPEP_0172206892 /NCGR_PEP_ID=MMETSP1050-20130122/33497_1 /TAXON_ID=233186 /ORGANISM="Cryptomonas curvata, Strain CCAP979/52" /LENGTH=86 /DNA_ID=CAMNT_0012886079 /DNA_START=206 /DNA_END=463 /DNA_ORIENTATION=-
MEYSGEAFNVPKQWNFRRTWTDFVALDTALRSDPRFMRVAGSDLLPVPDRPYLIGEGADAAVSGGAAAQGARRDRVPRRLRLRRAP